MKSVLLVLDAGHDHEGCLRAALDLTEALRGHLICVDTGAVQAQPGRFVADRLGPRELSWEWIAAGEPAGSLAETVAFADIFVTHPPAGNYFDPDLPRITSDPAVGRNLPVLVVPKERNGLDVSGNVLVAWDGSNAVLAALRCAVPLLLLAGKVTLLEIDDRRSGPSAEAAARYLSRYGISATIDRVHSLHRPTADVIEAHAASVEAAYIVMGAYGHSRTKELFFGGATQSMIDKSGYPLLLAR